MITFFFLNHLPRMSQNKCHVCHNTEHCIFLCPLCVLKKIAGFLISNIRALFQHINFPAVQNAFRENFYILFEQVADSDVTYIMLFETITLVRRKVLHFSFVVFSLILRVYLTYLIIFSLANDNTKFWIIFLQKYSSKCYVHHMRVAL